MGQLPLKEKKSYLVIKLRSFCIELADLIYRAFPESKGIFLYRNAENVVQSSIPAFAYIRTRLKAIADNTEMYSKFIPLLKDYAKYIDFNDSNATDLYTTLWLSVMQCYLLLEEQGILAYAIRYEDMIADPEQVVSFIFKYCKLPISEVANACQVFEKDSQTGSTLSRESIRNNYYEQLPDMLEVSQKVNRLLQKHPKIKTPDFIVPGTLSFSR
ncbi:sulfotransferase [Coleofasciculus sp.]|uniref:sulfotransferase n=1 Tax=Coleofasciculus sp. TaxID=3100458 RepID=UPI003A383F3A